MPAPAAAEASFTGEAESTKQPEPQLWVGAVPVVPLRAVKPAPVLESVSEFGARVAPPPT